MSLLSDNSVDAVVTDPPYGLNREPDCTEVVSRWLRGDDYSSPGRGYMGRSWDSFVPGPSTWREALRVLKPGAHLLAFGGPRTYDLLTVALRLAGFEVRDSIHWVYGSGYPSGCVKLPGGYSNRLSTSHEPIVVARKPHVDSLRECFAEWGTGALNVDACRVPRDDRSATWPPNTVISDIVANALGRESRYFATIPYCPKPCRREKELGLEGFEAKPRDPSRDATSPGGNNPSNRGSMPVLNTNPCVKPIELLQWLCRLVTPAGGVVLDPFVGSGTTGCAAAIEGYRFLGIEQDGEQVDIARARVAEWTRRAAGAQAA